MQKCPIDEETGNELLSGIALSVRVRPLVVGSKLERGIKTN